jgi:hypothetical protein
MRSRALRGESHLERAEMVDGSGDMWTLILVIVIFSGSVAGGVAGNTAK